MSIRTSKNLDLIVAFLNSLASKEQQIYLCQLHAFTIQALQDNDIYGEVRKQLEGLEQSFRFCWPINYKEVADNISKYL